MNKKEEKYWTERYEAGKTGWDIGSPSTPIKTFLDGIEDKELKILIPGAGNAYEAEYTWQQGFHKTYILDISKAPLEAFKKRVPDFPESQLLHGDFFTFSGKYDLILEQTFFCSFLPTKENRMSYAKKMHELLVPGGKLAGVLFDLPLNKETEARPFGGTKEEYKSYFEPLFQNFKIEKCYNSIGPRMRNEFFIIGVR